MYRRVALIPETVPICLTRDILSDLAKQAREFQPTEEHLPDILRQAAARKADNFDHFVGKAIFKPGDDPTLTDDEQARVCILEKGLQRYLKFHNDVYDFMDAHKIPQTVHTEQLLIDYAADKFKEFKLEDFVLYHPSVSLPKPGEITCAEVSSCDPHIKGTLAVFFFGEIPHGCSEYSGPIHHHNLSGHPHPHCESVTGLWTAYGREVFENIYDKTEADSPTFKLKKHRPLNKASSMIDLGQDPFFHQLGIKRDAGDGFGSCLGDGGQPTLLQLGLRHLRVHHYFVNRGVLNTYYPDATILP